MKVLTSFPSATMQLSPEDFDAVVESSHAAIREAKAAGVYVFAGGIDESVAPVLVDADGTITHETSPLDGGFCVLEAPTRADAEAWARPREHLSRRTPAREHLSARAQPRSGRSRSKASTTARASCASCSAASAPIVTSTGAVRPDRGW